VPSTRQAPRLATARLGLVISHDHFVTVLVVTGEQELIGHRQAVHRADIVALRAETASSHKDTDLLILRDELNGDGRTYLDAQLAADTGITIVRNLAPEAGRGGYGWYDETRISGCLGQKAGNRFGCMTRWKPVGCRGKKELTQ